MIAIRTPSALSELIAAQERAGFGFRNPLYRAILAGEIGGVWDIMPRARIPREAFWQQCPSVIVLSDDAGISKGPADFPDAARPFQWAASVMLHAAGGVVAHYRAAASAARIMRRVLIIETRTAHEIHWEAMALQETERRTKTGAPALPVLIVRVPDHLPAHPTIPDTQAEGARAHG
jgi:hypothetical protein